MDGVHFKETGTICMALHTFGVCNWTDISIQRHIWSPNQKISEEYFFFFYKNRLSILCLKIFLFYGILPQNTIANSICANIHIKHATY